MLGENSSCAVATRSPKEIIEVYWEEVWNNGNAELIREICADPIIRHDPGSVTELSHDEQVRRVGQQVAAIQPYFTHEVLIADDTHVVSVWNMVSRVDDAVAACGIETFRAENGRFTHCWNAPYAKGSWGKVGDASVPEELPPPEYPGSIDTIDHLWLQKMFKAAGVEVPRIAMVSKAERIGNGTTSDVARLQFGYNADAERYPHTLIAKISHDHSASGEMLGFFGYDREVAAYRFFGANPGFRIPRCYYAAHRGIEASSIILEDVGRNARPGDQIAGCSVDDAKAVMDTFAAMHIRYLADADVAALDWPLHPACKAEKFAALYAAGVPVMRSRYGAELGEQAIGIIEAVTPMVEAWLKARPPVETLIHGEPRVDNIIFEATAEGNRACLIDLQQISYGDPVFDLAYFLTGSLEPDARAACERDLVERHAAALHFARPDYAVADAWERYRQNAIAGLLATVGSAGLGEPPVALDRLLVTLARRNCAAITALDGLSAAREKIALGAQSVVLSF